MTRAEIDAARRLFNANDFDGSLAELFSARTRALRQALDALDNLTEAARAIYYAGVWSCDRTVDEAALWTALRDAAGFTPGQSPKPIEGTE